MNNNLKIAVLKGYSERPFEYLNFVRIEGFLKGSEINLFRCFRYGKYREKRYNEYPIMVVKNSDDKYELVLPSIKYLELKVDKCVLGVYSEFNENTLDQFTDLIVLMMNKEENKLENIGDYSMQQNHYFYIEENYFRELFNIKYEKLKTYSYNEITNSYLIT